MQIPGVDCLLASFPCPGRAQESIRVIKRALGVHAGAMGLVISLLNFPDKFFNVLTDLMRFVVIRGLAVLFVECAGCLN